MMTLEAEVGVEHPYGENRARAGRAVGALPATTALRFSAR